MSTLPDLVRAKLEHSLTRSTESGDFQPVSRQLLGQAEKVSKVAASAASAAAGTCQTKVRAVLMLQGEGSRPLRHRALCSYKVC